MWLVPSGALVGESRGLDAARRVTKAQVYEVTRAPATHPGHAGVMGCPAVAQAVLGQPPVPVITASAWPAVLCARGCHQPPASLLSALPQGGLRASLEPDGGPTTAAQRPQTHCPLKSCMRVSPRPGRHSQKALTTIVWDDV